MSILEAQLKKENESYVIEAPSLVIGIKLLSAMAIVILWIGKISEIS